MTITNNVSNYNDVLLDNQTQFGTISQQPTANSQQPTANSQQLTAHSSQLTKLNSNQNNILFYNTKSFIEKSSLGISLRFVRIANYPLAALFLCLGRLCFAGGASRSLLSLCSFDVSLRKHFGRSLRELPPQLTHRLSFSIFFQKICKPKPAFIVFV